jgi:hypothetical protein
MSWTYSDPTTNDRDKVRLLVGDVDQLADATLSDQDIAYLLTANGGSLRPAAAAAADALAARYSQLAVQKSLDGLVLDRTKVVDSLRATAKDLRNPAHGLLRPQTFVGGLSQTIKERHEEDDDEVQPYFRRGMQEAGSPPDVPGPLRPV